MGGTNHNDVEIAEINAKSQEEQARMYAEASQKDRDAWDKYLSEQTQQSKTNLAEMQQSRGYPVTGSTQVGGSTTVGRP